MNIRALRYSVPSALALAIGLLGCAGSDPSGAAPPAAPAKDIPAVQVPSAKYAFFEPTSEEGLRVNSNYGYLIAKATPGFRATNFSKMGLEVVGCMTANGATYFRLHRADNVLTALREVKRHPGILFVEPELRRYLHSMRAAVGEGVADAEPTGPIVFDSPDPKLEDRHQWAPYATKAYDAWTTIGFGGHNVHVAKVDTGVQYNHPDFQYTVKETIRVGDEDQEVEVTKSTVKHAFSWFCNEWGYEQLDYPVITGKVPMDGDTLLELIPDFKDKDSEYWESEYLTDHSGHGTHAAGIMVAAGNNGTGIAGMAWGKVSLIDYKGFDFWWEYGETDPRYTYTSAWTIFGSIWHLARWKEATGYTYTIPINFSLGGPYASHFEIDMIEHGLQKGIVMVASSGNDGGRVHQYPASYAGVIAVGATDGGDRRAPFSNYGDHISVVAPGAGIYSLYLTYFGYDEKWMSGTSAAAPQVTGLIGYMLTFNPGLTPGQIKTYIEQNADYVDGKDAYSEECGWGRINVLETIKAVKADAEAGKTPASGYSSTVKMTIDKAPDGLPVHLFNCDPTGSIANYVASSFTGPYYAFSTPGGSPEHGVAYFNMLRPGYYIAKCFVTDKIIGNSDVFAVSAGQGPVDVPIHFDVELPTFLTIQTVPTQDLLDSGWANQIDTEITVLKADGGVLQDAYRVARWDTLTMVLPSGTYYIKITDYNSLYWATGGEYALYVTKYSPWDDAEEWVEDWIGWDTVLYIPVAPGNFVTHPAGPQGTQAKTFGEAQEIELDTMYYACFEGDYYQAPEATDGLIGHFYKVVLQ